MHCEDCKECKKLSLKTPFQNPKMFEEFLGLAIQTLP